MARRRAQLERATEHLGPLAHPGQPEAAPVGGRRVEAGSPVGDDQLQPVLDGPQPDLDLAPTGVPGRVRQRLLQGPVERDLDRQPDLVWRRVDAQADRGPGLPLVIADRPLGDLLDRERLQLGQPQPARDRPDLAQRLPHRALDRLEVGAGRLAAERPCGVEPEQRQRERLAGTIVQVGADAAQRLLVQSRRPHGGLPNALVQMAVLLEQVR